MERRRQCRLPLALEGTIKARDGRWAESGILEDLHHIGACVRIGKVVAVKEDESVVVDLAMDPKPEEVSGRVRWTQRCEDGSLRFGIAFDESFRISLPLETAATACARLQQRGLAPRLRATLSLLEKTALTLHGETWAGGLLGLCAEPAQQVFNTLGARLDLESVRLQRVLTESRTVSAEAPLHPLLERATNLLQALQNTSAKVKECISIFRVLQGAMALQPESYLYTVDPADILRQSVMSLETLCTFLGGKIGVLRFKMVPNGLPLLAIRPLDFACCVNGCLLGLLESALASDGSTLTVETSVTDGWVGIRFGHDGFRMIQSDSLHITLDDVRFMENVTPRDERTVLRFYHAILPLREYGASVHIRAESGYNRVQVRLPAAHVFTPGKLKS
ncbi:MAG: PilZ domain-containing protein [Desulfosoma sp.]